MNFKKNSWCWVLLFALAACHEEKVETVAPAPVFYPVSVTRTASYSPDTLRTEYTYNQANQITKETIFKNGSLQNVNLFAYTPDGKLAEKSYFNEKNEQKEKDVISYQPAQNTFRLDHAYVNAGVATPHHFRIHETNAAGEVIKWTDFAQPTGNLLNTRTYQYSASGYVFSPFYGNQNQHLNSSQIMLDARNTPLKNTQINLVPYAGNELKHEIIDPSGQNISAYSQAITYNEAGYPLEIIQTHQDGVVKTEKYTYREK